MPISDAFYGQPWPAFCITTGRGQVPRGVPKRSRGTASLVQGSGASCFRWSVPVKRLTARRFHPLQSPSVNERGKSWRRRAPMMMFVFAVQIVGAVIGIFWATVAVTARQSPPEHMAMEETGPESDWPITPAHLRMW